jgi:hypothetical protein
MEFENGWKLKLLLLISKMPDVSYDAPLVYPVTATLCTRAFSSRAPHANSTGSADLRVRNLPQCSQVELSDLAVLIFGCW